MRNVYKNPTLPPEARIQRASFSGFLDQWELKALALLKKDFFNLGLKFASLENIVKGRVSEDLRQKIYADLVFDSLPFPFVTDHERMEGERRLEKYRNRLRRLIEISGIEIPDNDQALMRDSLRFPPASTMVIQSTESRLGIRLPPSYREFLSITNGWLIQEQPSLLPVEKIAPLRDIQPEYIQIWQDYDYFHEATEFVETPEPLGEGESFVTRDLDMPTACLNDAIAIGVDEREMAFLLLDPINIDERDEWRAFWLFRYEFAFVGRDFARLMEIMYRLNNRYVPE